MLVQDYITNQVVTVTPETSTQDAFGLMKSMGIRHLLVVKDGIVEGIVTDRDLRRPKASDQFRSWHDLYRIGDEIAVEDVMSSPVITVDAHTDVREAAQRMLQHKIGAVAVSTPHTALAGIFTETDALRALITTPDAPEPAPTRAPTNQTRARPRR